MRNILGIETSFRNSSIKFPRSAFINFGIKAVLSQLFLENFLEIRNINSILFASAKSNFSISLTITFCLNFYSLLFFRCRHLILFWLTAALKSMINLYKNIFIVVCYLKYYQLSSHNLTKTTNVTSIIKI